MNVKKLVQDVLPPDDERSIRRIPLPNGRKVHGRGTNSGRGRNSETQSSIKNGGLGGARRVLWGIAIFAVLFAIGAFASLFSRATVTITPKSIQTTLNASFVAYPEAIGDESLIYQEITVRRQGSEKIEAVGEEKVSQVASGQILIYNNHSTVAQRLIKNTRFDGFKHFSVSVSNKHY